MIQKSTEKLQEGKKGENERERKGETSKKGL